MKAFLLDENNVIINVIAVDSTDGWEEKGYVFIQGEDYIGRGCKYFPETGILLDSLGREIDTANIARDIEAERARNERNLRLQSEVDSVVFSNNWVNMTPSERDVILAHRQNLLDITKQVNFPFSIEWPVL